jgi:hypothetical protein
MSGSSSYLFLCSYDLKFITSLSLSVCMS